MNQSNPLLLSLLISLSLSPLSTSTSYLQAMATTSPELTPHALAALWKKQGGFDSLRKQLLTDFLASVRPLSSSLALPVHSHADPSPSPTQPERDALLSRLDALLPTLLSHPPVSRQARKDRPASALAELDRRLALKEWSDKLDVQLRTTEKGKGGKGGKRVGRRVEKELARTLRTARGQKVEEEESSEEEEEFEEEVVVNGGNLRAFFSFCPSFPSTISRD